MYPADSLKNSKKGLVYSMNKYFKEFMHRGMMFSGFGPVMAGIIYLILSFSISDFSLNGVDVFIAIISTYLLAFVHAGASVFNQMYHWPLLKSVLCHFLMLYVAYVLCYLVNTWIPFDFNFILIFTAIFVAVYLVIWLIVYITIKLTSKRLNTKL